MSTSMVGICGHQGYLYLIAYMPALKTIDCVYTVSSILRKPFVGEPVSPASAGGLWYSVINVVLMGP
jgi:hypothetical protein